MNDYKSKAEQVKTVANAFYKAGNEVHVANNALQERSGDILSDIGLMRYSKDSFEEVGSTPLPLREFESLVTTMSHDSEKYETGMWTISSALQTVSELYGKGEGAVREYVSSKVGGFVTPLLSDAQLMDITIAQTLTDIGVKRHNWDSDYVIEACEVSFISAQVESAEVKNVLSNKHTVSSPKM